jgi:hypothetical protein
MDNFNLIVSAFYIALGAGIMGFALGHAQLAWLESQNKA